MLDEALPMNARLEILDYVVLGGGAAGFFSAINRTGRARARGLCDDSGSWLTSASKGEGFGRGALQYYA